MTTGGESPSRKAVSPIRNNCRESLAYVKTTLRIGEWNVRTLNTPGNKEILIAELKKYKIDICALTETHISDHTVEQIDGYQILNSGYTQETTHRRGVAIAVSNKIASSLMSYEKISERLMTVRSLRNKSN